MKKFGHFLPVLTKEHLVDAIVKLFPKVEQVPWREIALDEVVPLFKQDEVVVAAKRDNRQRIPGLDGISGEAVQVLAQVAPEKLIDVFNYCLTNRFVPGA